MCCWGSGVPTSHLLLHRRAIIPPPTPASGDVAQSPLGSRGPPSHLGSAALGPVVLLAPPHPVTLAGLRGQGKGRDE